MASQTIVWHDHNKVSDSLAAFKLKAAPTSCDPQSSAAECHADDPSTCDAPKLFKQHARRLPMAHGSDLLVASERPDWMREHTTIRLCYSLPSEMTPHDSLPLPQHSMVMILWQ